jgi:peptidoglycan/xylan/chitin deacetylase (PgdA/CDA1 family)
MKIIMYHYVRPNSSDYPFFKNLDLKSFSNQLDYFESKYSFMTKEDYFKSMKTGIPKKGIVLTFDDGFKDHFQYVLPELTRRGLWGIFYIPTAQYSTNKLLGVHRVHYLKGKYGSSFILKEILKHTKDYMISPKLIKQFSDTTYHYSHRDEDEKKLQRLLNYYIDYEFRDQILDVLMLNLFDESKLFDKTYLNKNEIIKLHESGNIVGPHSVNHKVLSRLSYEDQFFEINESLNFLNNIIDIKYKSFCYPYGYKSSYNATTKKILESLNFDDACIFDNKLTNKKIEKYELSRIDCNQFLEV